MQQELKTIQMATQVNTDRLLGKDVKYVGIVYQFKIGKNLINIRQGTSVKEIETALKQKGLSEKQIASIVNIYRTNCS